MSNEDLTLHILRDIREQMNGTNARLDRLEQRVDQVVANQLTMSTEMIGLSTQVRLALDNRRELRPRVEQCEADIAELKRRLPPESPK